jgi:diacylglycerol kinase family enzyme
MSAMAPILIEPGSFFALGCCMPSLPVLINPRSGSGFGDRDAKRLGELFRSAGAEPSIRLARSHEELVAAAKQLVGERAPLLVAGGGDGTMNAVASVLAGSNTALGVLPLGTLNHFARDLRIPLALDAAVEIIVQGRRRSIDVGEVNGRVFVNNSSLGLYPAMVHRREKLRRRLGGGKWRAMLRAMLIVLRSHPFLEVALELDGVTHRRRTPFVFVGNNVYKMEGFTIGLREDLDRGVLSVYVTHRRRRLGLVLLALRALFGLLHQARDFEASTTRGLRIESRHRRLLVATDGEVAALETPLDYRIRPGALQVIAP